MPGRVFGMPVTMSISLICPWPMPIFWAVRERHSICIRGHDPAGGQAWTRFRVRRPSGLGWPRQSDSTIYAWSQTASRFEETLVLAEKDLIILKRGRNRLAIINKMPESIRVHDCKTHASPGRYQDINTGLILDVGAEGLITNYVVPPMTARLLIKMN